MSEQILENSIRDQIFSNIRSNPDNNYCLDCEKKNPKWASVYLGIHLCIDCAGKHRQFGVIYSFVKSTNLDTWTRRHINFMEKGGNARALDYFKKCGIINSTNKHIDYKNQIVQKYKALLTQEVDNAFQTSKTNPSKQQQKLISQIGIQQNIESLKISKPQVESNIQNIALEVQQEAVFTKNKKQKKVKAKKVNVDFDAFQFDDGVSQSQKQKMMKPSQPAYTTTNSTADNKSQQTKIENKIEAPKIEAPKQMEESTAKQTLEKLKQKSNVKAISSESFKDSNINSAVLQQNLNKFSGAQSISSAAFFGQQQPKEQKIDMIKNMLSSAGQKLYGKFSSYLKK